MDIVRMSSLRIIVDPPTNEYSDEPSKHEPTHMGLSLSPSILSDTSSIYSVDSFVKASTAVVLPISHDDIRHTHGNRNSLDSWIYSQQARNFAISLLTVMYAVVLVIYSVMLEIEAWIVQPAKSHTDITNFYIYINTVAYIFFAYLYICWALKYTRLRFLGVMVKQWLLRRRNPGREVEHERSNKLLGRGHASNIGSLYLRLGAVVFAVCSIVYFCYHAYFGEWLKSDITNIIFIVFQTHFIFCSSILFAAKHPFITRLGLMHLVAVNLYTWFSFFLIKGRSNLVYIEKAYIKQQKAMTVLPSSDEDDSNSYEVTDYVTRIARAAADTGEAEVIEVIDDFRKVENSLGLFAKVLYTAIVEYSLIAAAIMFIAWQNADKMKEIASRPKIQKKSTVRMNCSQSVGGLLTGFAFLTGTAVSMAFYFGYNSASLYFRSSLIYSITDACQHLISLVASILAIWQIRLLAFPVHEAHAHGHEVHAQQELLDTILLAIGLLGELCYSITALLGICLTNFWNSLSIIMLISHISRISQVIVQAFLISMAAKLKKPRYLKTHPGKQTITFLIIANIAMFIMNLFEQDKVGVSDTVINFYGIQNWTFLIRIFSPLTVFYQFHSSVCLAEIWKNTYSTKH